MNDSIEETFERFWKGFDPKYFYSDRTKDFMYQVWIVLQTTRQRLLDFEEEERNRKQT